MRAPTWRQGREGSDFTSRKSSTDRPTTVPGSAGSTVQGVWVAARVAARTLGGMSSRDVAVTQALRSTAGRERSDVLERVALSLRARGSVSFSWFPLGRHGLANQPAEPEGLPGSNGHGCGWSPSSRTPSGVGTRPASASSPLHHPVVEQVHSNPCALKRPNVWSGEKSLKVVSTC